MRALRIVGERQVIVRDKPEPRPRPDEVVVKIVASAICGRDLHASPHAPRAWPERDWGAGREPGGRIAGTGREVRGWSVGAPVVAYSRRTCGEWLCCRTGRRNVCGNRRTSYGVGAGGSDAEYMAVE